MLSWTIYTSFLGVIVLMVGRQPLAANSRIDFETVKVDKQTMSTAKQAASKVSGCASESKTWGTLVVEKYRPRMNKLTAAERERLLERAMQIAYGDATQPADTRRR